MFSFCCANLVFASINIHSYSYLHACIEHFEQFQWMEVGQFVWNCRVIWKFKTFFIIIIIKIIILNAQTLLTNILKLYVNHSVCLWRINKKFLIHYWIRPMERFWGFSDLSCWPCEIKLITKLPETIYICFFFLFLTQFY